MKITIIQVVVRIKRNNACDSVLHILKYYADVGYYLFGDRFL